MIIKSDDILQKLAKQKGIPYEMLRILFNDYWQQTLMHLQHPENNFIKGILIRDCIKIRLNPKQICKAYCSYLKYPRESFYTQNLLITHKQLLDEDIYTEKQKKLIQDCERNRIQTARTEGDSSDEEE
jgi:hypothetical protein